MKKKFELRGYITGEAVNLTSEMLKSSEDELELEITSVGGSFFAASSMTAMIRDSKRSISMHVQGLAASAASYLLTSATRVSADRDAMLMLHNARLTVFDELTKEKAEAIEELLERVNEILANSYASKMKSMSLDEIKDKLKNDWWISAQEALDLGLIDEIREATVSRLPQNIYAISASIVNSFDSVKQSSIFCDLQNRNQPTTIMKDLDKVLAAVGAKDADGLLDAVTNIARERDAFQAQLNSKSELVNQLTTKATELEQSLAQVRAELDETNVGKKVDEIVKSAGVIVSDEIRAGIERRVKNALKISDEAIRADMHEDARIYAVTNGVKENGPAGTVPDRKPNAVGASYEDRLFAKVQELKNAGVELDEAYKQARKLVKDKEV